MNAIYDEFITQEMAKNLLGVAYKEGYTYKLVTTRFAFCVLGYNSIGESFEVTLNNMNI